MGLYRQKFISCCLAKSAVFLCILLIRMSLFSRTCFVGVNLNIVAWKKKKSFISLIIAWFYKSTSNQVGNVFHMKSWIPGLLVCMHEFAKHKVMETAQLSFSLFPNASKVKDTSFHSTINTIRTQAQRPCLKK